MYEYAAQIVRVVDGDTVHAEVDFGCDTYRRMILRLHGINAPEMKTPEGKDARTFLAEMVEGRAVTLHTVKDRTEKYGRYLATLFVAGAAKSVNETMVASGHAVPYMADR